MANRKLNALCLTLVVTCFLSAVSGLIPRESESIIQIGHNIKVLSCPIIYRVTRSIGWKCTRDGKPHARSYPSRTLCQNSCKPGFLPRSGTNTAIYCSLDTSGKRVRWSGKPLVCEAKSCEIPVPGSNSEEWKCTHNKKPQNGSYPYRTLCQNKCKPGFIPRSGTNTAISCNLDMLGRKVRWSGNPLVCEPVKCASLPKVRNGQYNQRECNLPDSDRTFGKACSVTCNPGFAIPADVQWVCGADGQWSNYDKTVTCKDIEAPQVIQCDGPVTDGGVIYVDSSSAFVTWKEPEFSDNSNGKLHVYKTGSPGEYRVGRSWIIKYTARDTAGNTAVCEFSFILTVRKCPPLHRPANGALICDKLAFGAYCVPQCQRGLQRLLPDHIVRIPDDYSCTAKGVWRPHAEVGDCIISTPVNDQTLLKFEFCQDEATKQTIINNTINALANGGPSLVGQIFQHSHGGVLTTDDFEVFCGPKNASIIQVGGKSS